MIVWLITKLLSWHGVPMSHKLIEQLTIEQKKGFAGQARTIDKLPYFNWLTEEIELSSQRYMFEKGNIEFGKGMLYGIHLMKLHIKRLGYTPQEYGSSKEKLKMTRFL